MNGYAGRCSLEVCVVRRKAKARCVGGWGASGGAPNSAPRDESARAVNESAQRGALTTHGVTDGQVRLRSDVERICERMIVCL